jgi:hypothetical protein
MRCLRLLAGTSVLLALAPALHAQVDPTAGTSPAPPPSVPTTVAAVTANEVDVRSGAGAGFYATSRLRKGERVEVIRDVDGVYLAIKPPPGSFSWINNTFVLRDGRYATVNGHPDTPTPVRVGSSLSSIEPTVEQVKLQRGALVVIIGPEVIHDDGVWLPIQPPPQEVRFIPKDAVTLTPTVETVAGVAPAPGTPAAVTNAVGDTPWNQAEQAERAGDFTRAILLYQQQAQQTTDRDLQMRCYTRIQCLQQGNRGSTPPGYQPGVPAAAQPGDPRLVSQQSQAVGYPAAPQASPPGRLRRAGFYVDNRPTYVLVDSAERPLMYVTAQPGLSLELFVNQAVELFGNLAYRNDLRSNYIVVSQVRQLQ